MRELIITLAVLLSAVTLTGGCTRKVYVPTERVSVRHDTVRELAIRVDSVETRDSVAVLVAGDTVFVTKVRERFRYRERTDTLYRSTGDTVRVSVPYPVERKLTKWEQTKMDFGGFAIWGAVAVVCVAVAWLIKKFRK